MNHSGAEKGETADWSDEKQKKFEDAIYAFHQSYGRAATEDELSEIWDLIAFPNERDH